MKKIASPKSTGGGGYSFEDKISAYFLVCMLGGEPPLAADGGIITKVNFQTRVDGWLLDDILLQIDKNDKKKYCAISVKSDAQFNSKGAPASFVSAIWQQLLEQNPTVFTLGNDNLAIAVNTLPSTVRDGINELFKKIQADPNSIGKRINEPGFASEIEKTLYKSFDCPQSLLKNYAQQINKKDSLLNSVRVIEFDFEDLHSQKEKDAIRLCKTILESGTDKDAELLWICLQQIAKSLRPNAGTIDRNNLLLKIEDKFTFKLAPKYENDWKRIRNHSSQELLTVRDCIGSKLHLKRTTTLDIINKCLEKSQVCIMLGSSGSGKTVLTKLWYENSKDEKQKLFFWVRGETFNKSTFTEFENSLDLKYPLSELINNTMGKEVTLVIDGLDRLVSEEGFKNVAILITHFSSNTLRNHFKIILTCQPEEWKRIQNQLSESNIDTLYWQTIAIEELNQKEFDEVIATYPTLDVLSKRFELRSLLYRPKVLDLIASKLSDVSSIDVAKWVGESDVIKWFWEKYVINSERAQKETILKKLAVIQADKSDIIISPKEVELHLKFIDEKLVKERLLKWQDNGLNFDHDSYGDWIRLQVLLEELDKGRLSTYLKSRIESPLWYKAIRLCSVYLIEQYSDLTKWKDTLRSLSTSDKTLNLAEDLFLEGIIFSVNTLPILESLWQELIDNNGDYLRRFLGRFLYVTTFANPSMIELAKQLGEQYETEAVTLHRIPYWPYWVPILRFLYQHKEDVIKIASYHVAKITDSWLRTFNWDNVILKKEAAELAILNAEKVISDKREDHVIYVGDIDKDIYRAALAGYKEFPERLKALVDEASGRIVIPPKRKIKSELSEESRARRFAILGFDPDDSEPLKPWQYGPKIRPDTSFQEVCLTTDAIYPIINTDPKYASEIILALLISRPTTQTYKLNMPTLLDDLELERLHDWYPPFYDKGPFLYFLHRHPNEGLDLVIKLINFAGERWADNYKNTHKKPHTTTIEIKGKEKKLYSDAGMYFWYMDYPPVPIVIVTALMSLEKWFYDLIDKKESVETYLEKILFTTNNVAFIGLLSAIARKEPNHFLKTLRPLLSVFLFFIWENDFKVQSNNWYITWSMQGKKAQEAAEKWFTMDHRKLTLLEWAKYLFLNTPELNDFFEKNHSRWTKELKIKSIDKDWKLALEMHLAEFDKKNYHIEEKNKKKYWIFQAPSKLQKKIDEGKVVSENKLLISALPMNSSQFIEQGKDLTDDQAKEIWENIKRLSELSSSYIEEDRPDAIADAIAGGIALLSKFKFDWLKQDKVKYDWCLKYIIDLISKPPQRSNFDSTHSVAKFHWDCFCSTALPYFWADNLSSKDIKKCIALLAVSYHYNAVKILFQTCSELRNQLGNNFKQLQHLLFNIAEAKWKSFEVQYQENPSFSFNAWLKEETVRFSEDKIDSNIPKWSENVISYQLSSIQSHQKVNKKKKNNSGLDTELIRYGFDWLPLLKEAQNQDERKEWIGFWREALAHVMNTLGEQSEDKQELEGVPGQWEYWVLNRIAILIVELEANEQPDLFWKPILELSAYAHYAVERFLEDFIMYGPRLQRNDRFIKVWHSMLDYAFSSSKWDFNSKKYSTWTLGDLWWKLMGLDISRSNVKTEEIKGIIAQTETYFEKWANKCLTNDRCALKFIYFLSEEISEQLRMKGLIWLGKVIDKLDSYYFWSHRDDSSEKALASLLNLCWLKHKTELKNNSEAFEAFKHILSILVVRQNTIAMELQSKISK